MLATAYCNQIPKVPLIKDYWLNVCYGSISVRNEWLYASGSQQAGRDTHLGRRVRKT